MRQPSTTTEMATHSEEEETKKDFPVLAHRRFLLFSFFVGFSMLEYGFDSGEISAFQAMVGFLKVFGYKDPKLPTGWNIKSTPQQIISSFVLLGSFIASLLAGLFGRFLGRRHCVMVGLVFLIVGVTVQIVTTNLGALYFGRLMTGLANGFIMNFTFVYIAEMSPAHLRGVAYGLATGWVTLGAAIGYVITNATEKIMNRLSYQIPLYTLYLIPIVMILGLFFLPESPRWLLLHGKQEQALRSLTWIRAGASSRFDLLREYEEMKLNVEHEIMNRANVRFLDQFTRRHIRRTLISVGVGVINPAVAGMFAMAFMTYFMQVVGVEDPFKWGVMAQFIGYFGQLLSYPFIAMFGRRTMLLIGSSICGVSMLILGILFTPSVTDVVARSKGVIFAMAFYQFGFNFGVVGLVYMVSGEIPAQNLRSYTAGLSIGSGFIFAWLTAFTAPYFINPAELNWGGKYGFIWFGSSVLTILFVFFFVPEVRGRTLEEIEEMFDKGVPAWQFQTYVCENTEQAKKEAEQDFVHEEAKEVRAEHIEEATTI